MANMSPLADSALDPRSDKERPRFLKARRIRCEEIVANSSRNSLMPTFTVYMTTPAYQFFERATDRALSAHPPASRKID